jgi:hypothetical protein
MFCHAEILICATVLQHRLSTAIAFLSFHIQDNEDDFSGTTQNGLMLSDLYCLLCLLQCVSVNCKMSHQASCGVANMLKVHATLSRKKHAEEINACPGN